MRKNISIFDKKKNSLNFSDNALSYSKQFITTKKKRIL